MNLDNQKRFMYLFERVGEPIWLGPRGNTNVMYNVPMDTLSESKRRAQKTIRDGFSNMTFVNVSGVQMPDLSSLGRLCPRNSLFSYFIPNHRTAANQLLKMFTDQRNQDSFLSMASVCRDSEMVNCELWVHAFASACLQRRDMRGFRMPPLYEVMPDSFVNPHVVRQGQEQAALPAAERSVIVIDRNWTGQDSNPENRLAYFREDMAVNSHHWHWHLIYSTQSPRTGPGSRNRKGELFYYMHHSMIARYEAERLSNGMPRVVPLALEQPIPEGYFPKLTQSNSGIIWGSRQENTRLSRVDRVVGMDNLTIPLDDLRKWNDRVFEAIDSGVIIGANNTRIQLTEETGIDILGDIIENGGPMITPNERFYGNLHNFGHVLLAFAHDPLNRHREENGVMGDTTGAMRDPVFYRWHKYIDDIFDRYKQTLQPYTQQQLVWPGIQITSISVQTGKQPVNNLITHWTQRDIDLARGLDFTRNAMTMGPVYARLTTLDHMQFDYKINVTNTGRQAVRGTVRIFMAPRNDERNVRFPFREQRILFFELDKFATNLQPGQNVITRSSTESSVTIPWAQSFQDLERLPADAMQITGEQAVCGCGWPNHMLIPRGSPGQGTVFDLFVIITNAAEDEVKRNALQTANQRNGCKDSVSYCGILDELYPDKKAMGFPFDRNAVVPGTTTPIRDLDAFIPANSNMRHQQVRITHRPEITNVIGLAPNNMTFVNSAGAIVFPDAANSTANNANRNPSRNNDSRNNNNTSGGGIRPGSPQQTQATPGRGRGTNANINSNNGQQQPWRPTATPPRTPSPMEVPVVPINLGRNPTPDLQSAGSSPGTSWVTPSRGWNSWNNSNSRSPSPNNFGVWG